MKVIIDIEGNALVRPTEIWVIVCKDVDTGEIRIFRNLTRDKRQRNDFLEYSSRVSTFIGHNILGYDIPVLVDLLDWHYGDDVSKTVDTLVVSKMANYSRDGGHSLESYGDEFGMPKGIPIDAYTLPSAAFPQSFFWQWSQDLEDYCQRDVEITHKVYHKYLRFIEEYHTPLVTEQLFQYCIVNTLSTNGFSFNVSLCNTLLNSTLTELNTLDTDIRTVYSKRLKGIRTVTPRVTKYGTISKSSIPKKLRDAENNDLCVFSPEAPFTYCEWVEFNASSHKQLVDVLTQAGWQPTDKTATHIELEREINQLKGRRRKTPEVDLRLRELYTGLENAKKYGWKINEANLETLPSTAPSPARALAKRILLEARRRTLTEWLGLVQPDNRIHGKFYGIGAWTHRMAHQQPNTANIPNEFDTAGKPKLLGKEMRQLWRAPRNRLLVGVDAEGIQLRIFAHYIDDPEFTDALVRGRKDDKTDPHSLNQRILGDVCRSRAAAKRFIYALLLGAGVGKLTEILGCTRAECEQALDNLLARYTGFAQLKQTIIPADAARGSFRGLDGRAVNIPGGTEGSRRHLAMSGYLQNGEAICMKLACLKWHDQLTREKINFKLVNFVHDEWQTEVPNDVELAKHIAQVQCDSLRLVGEELGLKCPLAGSYWNDDHKDFTIGTNWYQTH